MNSEGRMKRDLRKRTFDFAARIVMLCREMYRMGGVNGVLARQVLRSGTSVGANVEEGQASQRRADFVSKFSIACKEARETLYWLRLIGEVDLIPARKLKDLSTECNELIAILTTIVKKSKASTNASKTERK